MTPPDHGTPIRVALAWLRDNTRLTKPEHDDLVATLPSAYRTYGDLPLVIERSEVSKDLVAKLKQVLK